MRGDRTDASTAITGTALAGELVAGPGAEMIGDLGHSIVRCEISREKYFIHDPAGQRICAANGHSEAIRLCTELIETGKISR